MGQESTKSTRQPLLYSYDDNGKMKTVPVTEYKKYWFRKIIDISDKGEYYKIDYLSMNMNPYVYHLMKNNMHCSEILDELQNRKFPKVYVGFPPIYYINPDYEQILAIDKTRKRITKNIIVGSFEELSNGNVAIKSPKVLKIHRKDEHEFCIKNVVYMKKKKAEHIIIGETYAMSLDQKHYHIFKVKSFDKIEQDLA
jgi:hypothetical protein